MASRAEIERQMAELQAQLDADDGDELLVETDKGHRVTLKGANAKKFLANLGLADEPAAADDGDGQGDGDGLPPDAPAGGESIFRRRR